MECLSKERSFSEKFLECVGQKKLSVDVKSSLEKKFELIGIGNRNSPEKPVGDGKFGAILENLKLDTSTQIWPEIPMTSEKSQKAASFGNISCQVSLNMYNDELHCLQDASMQASAVLSPRGSELEHKFTQVNFGNYEFKSPPKE